MFTLILYLINFGTMITIVFLRKKDMSTTFAWLLVLIFLPLIGFVFYFFFGSTRKLEVMARKYSMTEGEKIYTDKLHESMEMMEPENEVFLNPEMNAYKDMIQINAKNARCFFTEDNNVKLLINGENKFPPMFEEIRNAKKSINVMYFIYKTKDEIGKEFTKLLVQKAREGVEVRLLFDGLGCLKTKMKDFKELREAGGLVQRFLPSMFKTLLEVNYRLHRKMVVIDGKICYTGGINVGDDYLGKYPKITPWRDTSVRVIGSAVKELQFVFFRDWVFCAKQNKKMIKDTHMDAIEGKRNEFFPDIVPEDNMGVQIIQCGPDSKYATHKDSYVKMCTEAKDYLYIQSPYFVPDQSLLDAIRMAAQSGVDVRLMLPGIADKDFVYKVAMSYVEELLEAGIRVFTHKGFLHAKTMVIDDFVASVGTTNLDIRSFKLDYEVNTLVYSKKFAIECRNTFINDINDCKEIKLDEFKKRGKWQYIRESLCRFLAPLS